YRKVLVVVEARVTVPRAVRQRDPQLQPVQRRRELAWRLLGEGDALARGHQVELTLPGGPLAAQTIPVQGLPVEQPGHRLEPGVGWWRPPHPRQRDDRVWSEPVEEAPRTDHPSLAVRQETLDRGVPPERHLATRDQIGHRLRRHRSAAPRLRRL